MLSTENSSRPSNILKYFASHLFMYNNAGVIFDHWIRRSIQVFLVQIQEWMDESMKSFAIKEAPSPLSTLYVTLVSTQADDDANSVKACSDSLMSDLAFEEIQWNKNIKNWHNKCSRRSNDDNVWHNFDASLTQ